MAAQTAKTFPRIMAELDGMAEGLDLPFDEIFAWNCRGDLLASGAGWLHQPALSRPRAGSGA